MSGRPLRMPPGQSAAAADAKRIAVSERLRPDRDFGTRLVAVPMVPRAMSNVAQFNFGWVAEGVWAADEIIA